VPLTKKVSAPTLVNIMKVQTILRGLTAATATAVVLSASVFSATAAVPLISPLGTITDPGFEMQPVVGGQQELAGGDTIGGWTVGNLVTFYSAGNNLIPQLSVNEGNQAVLLRGDGQTFQFTSAINGSVSQIVTVTPGQSYTLNFAFGAPQAGSGSQAGVELKVGYLDNGVFQDFTKAALSTAMTWQNAQYTFTVPAGKTQARISFSGIGLIGTPLAPAAIDGPISLTAVPEPYQYGLVGMLGMLAFAARQFMARRKLA
jgi:hypothetical protein